MKDETLNHAGNFQEDSESVTFVKIETPCPQELINGDHLKAEQQVAVLSYPAKLNNRITA